MLKRYLDPFIVKLDHQSRINLSLLVLPTEMLINSSDVGKHILSIVLRNEDIKDIRVQKASTNGVAQIALKVFQELIFRYKIFLRI